MKFRVTPMRERGLRIPLNELSNRESFVGELLIYEEKDESGRTILVAALHGANKTSPDLLPPLYDVRIDGMAPLAFGLRGVERLRSARGVLEMSQQWWVRDSA